MGKVKSHFHDKIVEESVDGYMPTQCNQCKQWLDTPEDAEGCRDPDCPVIQKWYHPND